jgi:carbonic anhydrase
MLVSFCSPSLCRADDQPTGATALKRLQAGNARFTTEKSERKDVGATRRAELAEGPKPFAIILACADSRVMPEIIFDQGLGDIFVIRVAGNLAEPATLGSIEYAVEHHKSPLIVVLGHLECGAVKAAKDGGELEGNLGWLVKRVHTGKDLPKDAKEGLAKAIRNNAVYQAQQLTEQSKVIKEFVQNKRVEIAAGVYSLTSGKVDWLDVPVPKKSTPKESRIKVHVPTAEARLWFNDTLIERAGLERSFVSPMLTTDDKSYAYRVKVTWTEKGKELTREKRVEFHAGDDVVIDFRK